MNILVVAHYQNDGSPTAIFVHNQLVAYRQAGHEVRVVVPIAVGKLDMQGKRLAIGTEEKTIDGVKHFFVRYLTLSKYGQRYFNHNSAIAAVRLHWGQIFDSFIPDVIHAHTLGFDSRIGVWLKGRFGCPLVVTTHGSDTNIPLARGQLDYLRSCCDGVDRVVAVSSVLAESLRSCGTQTAVSSILNGFSLDNVRTDVRKIPMRIVQVCNLLYQKRVHTTIEAFAKLKKIHPGVTLTIVGSGPEREKLENLSRVLGIFDAVEFTGRLPNQNSMEEMAKAQFFVMPSVREGFGIVYAEAMASGCVTIGTRGEGIQDLIIHGENGFLVPADDPDAIAGIISECLANPERAETIAEQGEKAARELTWQNNAQKYIALFEELLQC